MNGKDLKIIRYLAGAMFALVGLSSILSVIFCLENSTAWGSYALTAISAILMAVSMFFIKYELLMAGAGVQVIVWFVNIFSMKLPITGWDIPKILFYILLIAGYVIIILATLRNKNACKYGFISVALIAGGYFVNFLSVYVMGAILGHTSFFQGLQTALSFTISKIVPIVPPIILACIVLENVPQAQTIKTVKQPPKTAKSDNRIEELTKLKDLLDTGVITQEEFDAKKKQILEV